MELPVLSTIRCDNISYRTKLNAIYVWTLERKEMNNTLIDNTIPFLSYRAVFERYTKAQLAIQHAAEQAAMVRQEFPFSLEVAATESFAACVEVNLFAKSVNYPDVISCERVTLQ